MRRTNVIAAVLVAVMSLGMCACGQAKQVEEKKADFSRARKVAELSTLECNFHNVAEFYNDGTQIFGGLSVGYKKAWFEYDGDVTLGVNALEVSIGDPDENGNVTITLPEAEVQDFKVHPETISTVYSDKGLITELTTDEQTMALDVAQNQMVENAKANSDLMEQARSRAGILLKAYVENVGKAKDETYNVTFKDLDGNDLRIVDGTIETLAKTEQETPSDEQPNQQETEPAQEDAGATQ